MNSDKFAITVKDAVLDFPFHNSGVTTIKKQIISLFRSEKKNWFRALNGIDLNVKQGEVVGILGPNGAGKSTLLRLVGGIYKPDRGFVQTNGRITMLAGYGLGFSPGLSGRENIHFSGGLLGMTVKELEEMEEEIIEFSGLGDFIESPLWTYSSGMRARLGFSIACFSNSDILLLDEVLSVGDSSFKKKSKAKIKDMVRSEMTVMIISHDLNTLQDLCDRLIYIENGRVIVDDDDDLVVKLYQME
tara:strand:- start:151 stop:885 length:735 start_codon:yes stop_codon:yes gene_type:complete